MKLTDQEQRNFNNVLFKNVEPGLMSIDTDDLAAKATERRAAMDQANPRVENWRGELFDLERRCQGWPSVENMKQQLEGITREHDGGIKAVHANLEQKRALLNTPYLDKAGQQAIMKQISRLEDSLPELVRQRTRAVALAKERVKTCEGVALLLPRLQTLRARERAIDRANHDPNSAKADNWIGPRSTRGGLDF
jgi:hypothetical protein